MAAPEGKLCLALDIEATGYGVMFDNGKHLINGVGMVLGDEQGNVILQGMWSCKTTRADFEDRCWEEFWAKIDPKTGEQPQMKVLAKLNEVGFASEAEMCQAIQKWLETVDAQFDPISEENSSHGGKKSRIEIVTDNPAYDVAALSNRIHKHAGREHTLRYSCDGRYRNVLDPSDNLWLRDGAGSTWTAAMDWIENDRGVKHDHLPVNDAMHHYLKAVYLKKIYNEEKAAAETVHNKRKA